MSSTLRITGIGRVAVPAAGQDRVLEFNVGTFGFELRSDETFPAGTARWMELAEGGQPTSPEEDLYARGSH